MWANKVQCGGGNCSWGERDLKIRAERRARGKKDRCRRTVADAKKFERGPERVSSELTISHVGAVCVERWVMRGPGRGNSANASDEKTVGLYRWHRERLFNGRKRG